MKDRVSDFPYFDKYLILTPSFMAGNEHRKKMGFIPIEPFRIGLIYKTY